MASFGDILKKIRKKKGISQSKVAEIAGVSLRTVMHWEKNEKEPGFYKVCNIAYWLDEDITRFISDENATQYAIRKEATKLLFRDREAPYGKNRKELLENIVSKLSNLNDDGLKVIEQLLNKMTGGEE